jgi:hypothetical protein
MAESTPDRTTIGVDTCPGKVWGVLWPLVLSTVVRSYGLVKDRRRRQKLWAEHFQEHANWVDAANVWVRIMPYRWRPRSRRLICYDGMERETAEPSPAL